MMCSISKQKLTIKHQIMLVAEEKIGMIKIKFFP